MVEQDIKMNTFFMWKENLKSVHLKLKRHNTFDNYILFNIQKYIYIETYFLELILGDTVNMLFLK